MKRPCLDCATPTTSTRCARCQNRYDRQRWANGKSETYNTAWRKQSADARAAWVEANGWTCPGWQRPAHPSRDLVVDHDAGVMCRSCNAVKANTYDRKG